MNTFLFYGLQEITNELLLTAVMAVPFQATWAQPPNEQMCPDGGDTALILML
jgi:hypothetical protein